MTIFMSFTVHDLPIEERPRERLVKFGSEALTSQELIALILGRGIAGESVMTTAQKLLSTFGSLQQIVDANISDLQKIRGIGLAKACQLKACFEIVKRYNSSSKNSSKTKKTIINKPEVIFDLLKDTVGIQKKEHFVVISLDTRNGLLAIDTISIGTLNASLVHPREVFDCAVQRNAAQIILSHNHPSGIVDPSDDDLDITKRLLTAGKIMGIEVVDHIIISREEFYSFKERKLM
ncbi:MAG TPA: DNA repair protein RadC [Candidatus Nitrosocosmicus sp.]|nr:DNA repair protein RadC [Candidatus Nitrosocosmicus sp.]